MLNEHTGFESVKLGTTLGILLNDLRCIGSYVKAGALAYATKSSLSMAT